jgi:hypothetical protein
VTPASSGATAAAGRGRASSGRGTSAARPGRGSVRTRTGLTLDPADPTDAQILKRQASAARKAGREGGDRAKVTQGRADLEAAYDEGAQATATGPEDESTGESSGPGRGRRAWDRYRQMGPGWGSVKPTSPARLPTRAADAGGFAAGLLLYTVTVIYIRYGPEGWKGWLKAKFLNQPMDPPGGKAKGHGSKTTPTKKSGKAAAV